MKKVLFVIAALSFFSSSFAMACKTCACMCQWNKGGGVSLIYRTLGDTGDCSKISGQCGAGAGQIIGTCADSDIGDDGACYEGDLENSVYIEL